MTVHRLEAPTDATTIIGDRHDPEPIWMILGTAYTSDPAVHGYALRHGYTITEVDEVPADYIEQRARLIDMGITVLAFTGDAIDPDQKYKFELPTANRHGQTTVDIRDVIAGRITKEELR